MEHCGKGMDFGQFVEKGHYTRKRNRNVRIGSVLKEELYRERMAIHCGTCDRCPMHA
jgi:hypothetical protein